MKLIINTDGGSRGNPGPSACAFVAFDGTGKPIMEDGKYLGICTNNEAEYQAVILALEKIVQLKSGEVIEKIEFKADSKLIVEQLSGRFKVKNPRMQVLHASVRELEKNLVNVCYIYVPRAENYQADKLVNQILDQELI